MAILMISPAGAQAQVSTTEAEALRKLGWRERTYEDFYNSAKKKAVHVEKQHEPVAKQDEKATIVEPQEKRLPGRPRKEVITLNRGR